MTNASVVRIKLKKVALRRYINTIITPTLVTKRKIRRGSALNS